MPEPETQNQTPAALPAAPKEPLVLKKQFDVALVDPLNPAIEHWPRMRVTVDVASTSDLTADQKAPPNGPDGKPVQESSEGEAKRLAFLVADIERQRAIAAYNATWKVEGGHLRYDVAPVQEGSPTPELTKAWQDHLKHISGR
ncbi:MAG TPA: hypothetical protein VGP68_14520 [Gemmataceae bacterium]|jgi:hypothetical protein|nr:hypothetical protein [Gemmataceae bacterium]